MMGQRTREDRIHTEVVGFDTLRAKGIARATTFHADTKDGDVEHDVRVDVQFIEEEACDRYGGEKLQAIAEAAAVAVAVHLVDGEGARLAKADAALADVRTNVELDATRKVLAGLVAAADRVLERATDREVSVGPLQDALYGLGGEVRKARLRLGNDAAPSVIGDRLPAGYETLVLLRTVVGHVAMWATRQSPYAVPEGLEAVLRAFRDAALPHTTELGGLAFLTQKMTWRRLESFLREHLLPIPEVAAWNEPKSGHAAQFVFVDRTGGPAPDDDFIDLDALIRNIARSVIAESLEDERL